jgi:Flp pilus assembly protein TadD
VSENLNQLQLALQSAIANQDWDSALQTIETIDQALPDNPSVAYNKGLILKNLGRLGEARLQFQTTLELDASHHNALFELASCEVESGLLESARSRFETYLTRVNDDVDAMTNLGNLLLRLGDCQPARGWLKQAHTQSSSVFIVQSLAIAERECGDLDACRDLLDQLDNSNPEIAAARLKILTQGSKGQFSINAENYLAAL